MPLNSIASMIPWWVTMLASPFTLILGSLLIVSLRSGSSHVIWNRLWSLAIGKRRVESGGGALRAVLDERQCLLEFRVHTGIRARTTASALDIEDWAKQAGEDLEDVGRCREFFDVDAVRLRKPLHRVPEALLASLLTGMLMSYLWLGTLAIAPRVWVILSSGTWVVFGQDDVRALLVHERFSQSDCAKVDASHLRHAASSLKDLQEVCQTLTQPNYATELADAVRSQHVVATSLAAGALPIAYMLFYWSAGAMAVRRMTKRIAVRRARVESGSSRQEARRVGLGLAQPYVAQTRGPRRRREHCFDVAPFE